MTATATAHELRASPLWPGAGRGRLPEDPALPGASIAANASALLERLREHHPGACSLEITQLRHKPGRSCVIAYRLIDGDAVRCFQGRACRPEDYDSVLAKTRAVVRPVTDESPVVLGLTDLSLVLTTFPHDRTVHGLRQLLDPERLKRSLRRSVPRFADGRRWVRAPESSAELVSYKPERHAVARCRLRVGDAGAPAKSHEVLFARAGSDGRSRALAGLHAALRADEAFAPLGAPVAEALGVDEQHDIVYTEALAGRSLLDRCDTARGLEACHWAGAFLARLHASRAGATRTAALLLPEALLPEALLHESAQTARHLRSSGLSEGALVLDACEDLRGGAPASSGDALIHGDFHPGQILVATCEHRCLDFDQARRGHPGIDLGDFLAHLRHLVRIGLLDATWSEASAAEFLSGYSRAGGTLPTERELSWLRRLSLVRLALSAMKQVDADWPGAVRFYLGEGGS